MEANMSETDERTVFDNAETGYGDWLTAAVAFAATESGRAEITTELLPQAQLLGDTDRATALQTALLRAEREAADLQIAGAIGIATMSTAPTSELQHVASDFGVALEQVTRDHAISHILATLAHSEVADAITFYGGTALSRTLLPRLRLSEDIDLITNAERRPTAAAIEHAINAALARSHGTVTWEPHLSATRGAQSAVIRLPNALTIRIQLMNASDLPAWPTEQQSLFQRYSDAPPATLSVFTPASFAAAKTLAWAGRATPRDLYDLWALTLLGVVDADAHDLYQRWGSVSGPGPWIFRSAPSDDEWTTALAHQGRVRLGPSEALKVVRDNWTRLTNDD